MSGHSTQGNPNGLQQLAKYSKIPIERIRYRSEADAKVIEGMDRGVLFLMAFWSGSSFASFTRMTEILSLLDKNGTLEFVVVDIDGSETLYEVPELRDCYIQGNGEAAWVRQGKIVCTNWANVFGDVPELNTVALMAMP